MWPNVVMIVIHRLIIRWGGGFNNKLEKLQPLLCLHFHFYSPVRYIRYSDLLQECNALPSNSTLLCCYFSGNAEQWKHLHPIHILAFITQRHTGVQYATYPNLLPQTRLDKTPSLPAGTCSIASQKDRDKVRRRKKKAAGKREGKKQITNQHSAKGNSNELHPRQ